MPGLSFLLLLLATTSAAELATPLRADKNPPAAANEVDPKRARDALAEAARLKRSATGREAGERHEILERAARAYEQVAREYAAEVEVGGEASFRAGEIWRTLKQQENAERCFVAVTGMNAPGWKARSWLELGHLSRRARRFDEAFTRYGRVLDVAPEQRGAMVDALTWQGKVLIEQKEEARGHALLLSVGQRFPDFPLDDIRNVDEVAVDWIQAERLDEARNLVLDCIARHERPDAEGKPPSEPVVRALGRMKSRELLAAAKD